jgi:N-formylglutamate deformylase
MSACDPTLISLENPPSQALPLVVAVPHAGRDYDARFIAGSSLNETRRRLIEDSFTDELASRASVLGAPLLVARFPRIWLDVNRDWRELDPLLIEGDLPQGSLTASNNVRAGFGVVPRLVTGGHEIYDALLPYLEIEARLKAGWHPYHEQLGRLIDMTKERFGHCLLIDCHSMPSGREAEPLDIVLGDGYGTTADAILVEEAENHFASLGYRVQRNRPYAGGFTTRNYGKPQENVHALQIEIRRGLYMDERRFERLSGINILTRQLGELFVRLGQTLQGLAGR